MRKNSLIVLYLLSFVVVCWGPFGNETARALQISSADNTAGYRLPVGYKTGFNLVLKKVCVDKISIHPEPSIVPAYCGGLLLGDRYNVISYTGPFIRNEFIRRQNISHSRLVGINWLFRRVDIVEPQAWNDNPFNAHLYQPGLSSSRVPACYNDFVLGIFERAAWDSSLRNARGGIRKIYKIDSAYNEFRKLCGNGGGSLAFYGFRLGDGGSRQILHGLCCPGRLSNGVPHIFALRFSPQSKPLGLGPQKDGGDHQYEREQRPGESGQSLNGIVLGVKNVPDTSAVQVDSNSDDIESFLLFIKLAILGPCLVVLYAALERWSRRKNKR